MLTTDVCGERPKARSGNLVVLFENHRRVIEWGECQREQKERLLQAIEDKAEEPGWWELWQIWW